jgi:DNA-binding MarR family transcriptional regulator
LPSLTGLQSVYHYLDFDVPSRNERSNVNNSIRTAVEATLQRQVLEALDGGRHVSQRRLADTLGIAVSQINRVIRGLVMSGYVEVGDDSVRPYAYHLTAAGRRHAQELSHNHYAAVVGSFRQIQERVRRRLAEIRDSGAERVAFYGGGEMAKMAYPLAQAVGLEVVAIVDGGGVAADVSGGEMGRGAAALRSLRPDAIMITSARHPDEVRRWIADESGRKIAIVEL